MKNQKRHVKFNPRSSNHREQYDLIKDMTARGIIDYVKKQTGEVITISPKNKFSIIEKAIFILKNHGIKKSTTDDVIPPVRFTISFKDFTKKELAREAKEKFGESIGGLLNCTLFISRETLVERLCNLYIERGERLEHRVNWKMLPSKDGIYKEW